MLALTHSPSWQLAHCELTHLGRQRIDTELARRQHRAYCVALQEAGVEVHTFSMNRQYADSAFVEDIAIVLDEMIILGAMGAKSREPETVAWCDILAKYRPIHKLPCGATMEGGDVLRIGKDLLIGLSSRTNAFAIEAVAETLRPLGYNVRGVPVSNCLHLKTACTALNDECLLINPNWINANLLPRKKILEATDEWGANVVRLPDRLLANDQNRATIEQLRDANFNVCSVELSEFAKAEAGATCLSLLI
jgi:dimethylargininase